MPEDSSMRQGLWLLPVSTVLLFVGCDAAFAADSTVSFTKEVLPLLAERCQACHSVTGQAQLSLMSWESLIKGGKSGTAIAPGRPDESLLLKRISGANPAMPPVGDPLDRSEVALIHRWVAEGAQNDDTEVSLGGAGVWWSFRPLTSPSIPTVRGAWSRNGVDRFVSAKHGELGLSPSIEADRTTLIRRLTYQLHGLPPTPEAVSAFLNDSSPRAYEDLVDRLLASPRYGERWGRHWLDVAHYGESHGYDKDKARRNSWPYRDYVIESFNADKPYERFVKEQLAGDYLWPDDPTGLIATGFIAAGPWDYVGHAELREGTKDKKLVRVLDRDDMVAQTMSTFASLTVHCARCHDHKFDAILQRDYYSLQAVFAGVDRAEQPYSDDPETHRQLREVWSRLREADRVVRPIEALVAEQTSDEIEAVNELHDALREESKDLLPKVGEVDTPAIVAKRSAIGKQTNELLARRRNLQIALLDSRSQAKLAEYEARREEVQAEFDSIGDPQYVYAASTYFKPYGKFTPAWVPRSVHLLGRGSVEAPGELVQPGAVKAVLNLPARFDVDSEGAGRAALAEWITHSDNPLSWRSIVNRVWHYHFGHGLADSPNDFGRMGGKPTHPELLDWLAVRFRDGGGSFKDLHRLILSSATYRQSSADNPKHSKLDAGNQYLWRMNRMRLDAEAVRDAVLHVSGRLDLTMGGPSAEQFFYKYDHSPIYDYARFDFASPEARRRSVYRFLVRSVQDPFMESLDCADPSLLVPKRSSTLTAIQALALLNDPLMVQESRYFADRLREKSMHVGEQIDYGIQLAFGRSASPQEIEALSAHADNHGLANAARLIFNSNEFIFVD